MEISSKPISTIQANNVVLFAKFSTFEWSQSLLAIGFPSSVGVYKIDIEVRHIILEFFISFILNFIYI